MHLGICKPRLHRVTSDAGGVTPLKEMWPIIVNVIEPPARSALDAPLGQRCRRYCSSTIPLVEGVLETRSSR
jgi:hypothetical protein